MYIYNICYIYYMSYAPPASARTLVPQEAWSEGARQASCSWLTLREGERKARLLAFALDSP